MATAMTLQDCRDYVRAYLDTDEDELPDTLIDVWFQEGYARLLRTFESWAHLRTTWSITITGHETSFTTLSPECESITAVELPTQWTLDWLPQEEAEAKYAWSSTTTALPREWSTDEGSLFLWPEPDTSQDYVVRGYRLPTEVEAAADEPDLPNEFHSLICEYMLGRAYERDDDEVMSSQKFNSVGQSLEVLRRRYTRAPSGGLHGLGTGTRNVALPDRMIYTWE